MCVEQCTFQTSLIAFLGPQDRTKIVGGWGFTPAPTGRHYSTPSDPWLGLRGPTTKAPTSKGRGRDCQNDAWSVAPPLVRGRAEGARTLVCWGGGSIWSYASEHKSAFVRSEFCIQCIIMEYFTMNLHVIAQIFWRHIMQNLWVLEQRTYLGIPHNSLQSVTRH